MNYFDVHIHTALSKCSLNRMRKIVNKYKKIGYRGIVITDHNRISHAVKMKELFHSRDFSVRVGVEVSSKIGHILCLGVKEYSGTHDVEELIKEVHKQGGVVGLAHPFSAIRKHGVDEGMKSLILKMDFIEALNGRNNAVENQKAIDLANELGMVQVAGSDAHFGRELGNARNYTEFENIVEAIKKKKVEKIELNKKNMIYTNLVSSFIVKKCRRRF